MFIEVEQSTKHRKQFPDTSAHKCTLLTLHNIIEIAQKIRNVYNSKLLYYYIF